MAPSPWMPVTAALCASDLNNMRKVEEADHSITREDIERWLALNARHFLIVDFHASIEDREFPWGSQTLREVED